MTYIAHITNINGVRKDQSLEEHCVHTAIYASGSLGDIGFYNTGYLAGLIHDMGKGKDEFKDYLEAAYAGQEVIRGSVNHTFAGVIFLLERYHGKQADKWQKLTSEIIAYAIGAHHGLFDCVNSSGENGFLHRIDKNKEEISYSECLNNFLSTIADEKILDDYFKKAVSEVKTFFDKAKTFCGKKQDETFFLVGLVVRLVSSALIYGDRRDTYEFMNQITRDDETANWDKAAEFYEQKICQFDARTQLNKVRRDISSQCFDAAMRPGGIYRLSVPTGGGKTLCSLRYALRHAATHHKKRIIFIIPLLSVLEQNAAVIKTYLPSSEMVLEHHSNVVREHVTGDELDPYELSIDRWDKPIVISTLVQLLEILFSHKTSAVARMQALSDSVIVIDEVQSLPRKTTLMFNMALNFLHYFCGATIILSSATQPCFETAGWPLRFSEQADIVELTGEQREVFKRVNIHGQYDPYGKSIDELYGFCRDLILHSSSLLIICNTKKEAVTLYGFFEAENDKLNADIFHLSTSMCEAHRTETMKNLEENLAEIQRNLKGDNPTKKLICVSTQIAEAGIDFSFESVVRVMAGIDNLAQAVGRCNRSNEYADKGNAYFIRLKNENLRMLPDIEKAKICAGKVMAQASDDELISDETTYQYYRYLFEETKNEVGYPVKWGEERFFLSKLLANKNPAASLGRDRNRNGEFFLRAPFKQAGILFKVFEENTLDVIVPYSDEGKKLTEDLRDLNRRFYASGAFKSLSERAKRYTVNIFEWQKQKLDEAGMLERLFEGRVMILDQRAYDMACGLKLTDEQPVDNYIL